MVFEIKSIPFNPNKDIGSLAGKVILVTGGNSGLGKQSILEFSRHNPAQIWLGARDLQKAKAAADDIRRQVPGAPIKLLELDLSSFESIKKAAKKFSSECDRLDILMLNAGLMGSAPSLTKEGYEIHIGVNHLGHALLCKLLVPVMERTAESSVDADVRVIVITSSAHKMCPLSAIEFEGLTTTAENMIALVRYGQSKLANILYARELAKRFPQFRVAAVSPGYVNTNIQHSMTGVPTIVRKLDTAVSFLYNGVEKGVKNQLWASVSKNYISGEYFEPVGVRGNANKEAQNDLLALTLWTWTEKQLKPHVMV
ncbi:hypothetical protein DL765_009145 [Monosporascus sp. GIB2]|nr:hypothetical protein DL765_009145 [Monosporascus sp. GIB2]